MWGGAPSFSTVSTALLVVTGVLLMGHLAPLASGKPTGPLFRRLLEREVAVNADGGMEAAAGGVPVGEGGEGGVGVNVGKHLHLETFTFAAGCFWGVQLAFERIPGVASSVLQEGTRTNRITARCLKARRGTPKRYRSSTTPRS